MRTIFYFFIITLGLISCKNNIETKEVSNESNTNKMKISLAQWSFHKALQGGQMDHLGFIDKAGNLGFEGVEYVSTFFKNEVLDSTFLDQMNERAKKAGVVQLLIMVDGEGYLADLDEVKRNEAVKNHYKWVDAAVYLGCHSIRVNAHGEGSREEVANAAVSGLGALADYAATKNINVIVENHGGYSSDGQWLSSVMSKINKPNCGTLPDFGNFCVKSGDQSKGELPCIEEYDRYKGVEELMPYAKAVSAKSHDFGELGYETKTDYIKMMNIVNDAGYTGFVGVEYEGSTLGEEEGILATKKLLEVCFEKIYAPKSE